jgi:AhpD family alkylhydroperoxidase
MTMTTRMNPYVAHYGLVKPLIDLGMTVQGYGLETSLMELVKIRASQINGCGVCLDMHAKEARKHGETDDRLLMLSAWRETSLYNEREKAAVAWTEALTLLPEKGAPDDVYAAVQANFSEEEQIALTLLVGIINSFNRIGVGFHVPPISEHQRKAA